MVIRCLFGHDWITGKVASRTVREALQPGPNTSTNRQCFRCGKKEFRADVLEQEYAARMKVREAMQ